jgi:hypothetical protein
VLEEQHAVFHDLHPVLGVGKLFIFSVVGPPDVMALAPVAPIYCHIFSIGATPGAWNQIALVRVSKVDRAAPALLGDGSIQRDSIALCVGFLTSGWRLAATSLAARGCFSAAAEMAA